MHHGHTLIDINILSLLSLSIYTIYNFSTGLPLIAALFLADWNTLSKYSIIIIITFTTWAMVEVFVRWCNTWFLYHLAASVQVFTSSCKSKLKLLINDNNQNGEKQLFSLFQNPLMKTFYNILLFICIASSEGI